MHGECGFAAKQLEDVSRSGFSRDVQAQSDHPHCDVVQFGEVGRVLTPQHREVFLGQVAGPVV